MPDITTFIESAMQQRHIPGAALAILRGDDVLYEGYHGLANLEHNVPVVPDTIWEIASLTKPFTAQTVLLLADEGRINLDAPLAAYVPDLPHAWRTITPRHCLSHQSGIPSYTDAINYWEHARKDKTHAEVLALVKDQPVLFPPGQRNNYDNTGYYVLGMMIEATTGISYGEVVQERVCAPLGLVHTRANDYRMIMPNRSAGYNYEDDLLVNKPPYSTSNTFSGGILVTTLSDLIQWGRSLQPDVLMPAATLDKMLTPYPSRDGNERQFNYTMCLGWYLVDHEFGRFIGHNGSIVGFASAFAYFPERNLTLISLCNQGSVKMPHALIFDTARHLLPELSSA
ncbi:MAG: beta-lactamase family protein [Anaerolineae bacterium]|nr:beta-lactamase family protein [Anaerolineae bacterium]